MKISYFSLSTLILLLLTLGIIAGCATSDQTSRPDDPLDPERAGEQQNQEDMDDREAFRELLTANRSQLGDLWVSSDHDMPESFLKRDTVEARNRNPFDGFRVQILSARNLAEADSVSQDFRMWADSTMAEYQPKPYVLFQQPFFKVHLGDFQNRQRALELSNLVKEKYPDAWVVHDRINPNLVPADTVKIDTVATDTTGIKDNSN